MAEATASAERGRLPGCRDIPIRLTNAVPVDRLVRGFLETGPHPGDRQKVQKARKARAKRL